MLLELDKKVNKKSRYTRSISPLPGSFTFQSRPKSSVSASFVRVPLLLLYYTKIIGFRQAQIMKIEINEDYLVSAIVEKVVEEVKPLFINLHQFRCEELMTVEEVRTYLKAKRFSIYEKVHTKSIPFL
jgi:hypothetical protein